MADDRIIEVYRRERGQIARSVARIAGDNTEDIVHDAFEAYLSHAPWANRPGAWISRVARNRALNLHRGMRLVPLEGHEETTTTSIDAMEREAVGGVVAEAMTALPDRPRTALRMRFFEGASYEDVAEALGVRVAQAHVVVHRALRMLGREMVRRLADAHGAGACAPALLRMAGIGGGEEHGHGPEPCLACRPAWDEIVALRAVNGFAPLLTGFGAVRQFFRRIADAGVRRGSDVVEPAGRIATALVAFGVAVASALAAPSAVDASDTTTMIDARPVAAVGFSDGSGATAPGSTSKVSFDKGQLEPGSGVGNSVAALTVDGNKGKGEVRPPGGQGGGGVLFEIQCPPLLEECPKP